MGGGVWFKDYLQQSKSVNNFSIYIEDMQTR